MFNGSLGLISTMEDGVVFLSRLYRKLRIYLDVIIVSAIMGFFAYRFTANSLINAVVIISKNHGGRTSLIYHGTLKVIWKATRLVSACIVVLVIILYNRCVSRRMRAGSKKPEYIEKRY